MEIYSLSENEKKIVSLVKEHDGLTFDELKNYMNLDKPTLREILINTLCKGIIIKVPDFDKGKFVYKVPK